MVEKAFERLSDEGLKITRCGKGFLLENPLKKNCPPVLHVQGTAHEMGYQHGFLLAGGGIPSLSSVYYRCGGWDPESGGTPDSRFLEMGRVLLSFVSKTYFLESIKEKAPDMIEELEGLAEGFQAGGKSFTFEDLLNWVSIFELGSDPELITRLVPEFEASLDAINGKHCTGIGVWGKATKDGKLIHGANQDIDTFGWLHKQSIVVVAKPDHGHPFIGVVWPGMPWVMTGMNRKGISLSEKTSRCPADNDIVAQATIPHFMRCRRIIQFADDLPEALEIMKDLGGGLGWNMLVSDKGNKTAADIEVSATRIAQVKAWDEAPSNERDAVWTTNHYNAYPGFRGYPENDPDSPNMAALAIDSSRIQNRADWQNYLRETAPSSYYRWERVRELIAEKHGTITAEDVIGFLGDTKQFHSDPPVRISQADPEIHLTAEPVQHLFGPDEPLKAQSLASAYSVVFEPEIGNAWIAAGKIPAQKGTYHRFNLDYHLALMEEI